ncbi:MAG: hypothetical protein ACRD1H_11390, partial [Vicinamibacterales bacterium]
SSTIEFVANEQAFISLDDGLAYDAEDDTLYVSADTATEISHYTADGVLLENFPWAGAGCFNSGLALGGDLLYQGSNGCNHVWVIFKVLRFPVFDFATGAEGVRDEDLECDSVSYFPQTVMWSVEAYEPRRAIAFEIPAGSCGVGGGVDSDEDGLLDEWESSGVSIDPDGPGGLEPQFMDLPAMGADPERADIFIHLDWMEDDDHTHALEEEAIRQIVEAFDDSPHIAPTGRVGINFHVDQGPDSILDFDTNETWGVLSRARALPHVDNLGDSGLFGYDWSAFDDIKNANTTTGVDSFNETGRLPIFHYAISAHNYGGNTSSGISRGIGASDFIVSLGSFTGGTGTVRQQAGTLMHELGHNLNLLHGGDDDTNYKPNYLSVMNYLFQLGGLIKDEAEGTFDYSRFVLDDLDENHLDETVGLEPPVVGGYGTRHYCDDTRQFVPDANGPIDWNCDGDEEDTDVSYDINSDEDFIFRDVLHGFDDWDNLDLTGGAIGLAGVTPDLPQFTELDLLTPEIAAMIVPLDGEPPPPPVTTVQIDIKPGAEPNT